MCNHLAAKTKIHSHRWTAKSKNRFPPQMAVTKFHSRKLTVHNFVHRPRASECKLSLYLCVGATCRSHWGVPLLVHLLCLFYFKWRPTLTLFQAGPTISSWSQNWKACLPTISRPTIASAEPFYIVISLNSSPPISILRQPCGSVIKKGDTLDSAIFQKISHRLNMGHLLWKIRSKKIFF